MNSKSKILQIIPKLIHYPKVQKSKSPTITSKWTWKLEKTVVNPAVENKVLKEAITKTTF